MTTERVIIGGVDYSKTYPEARAIMYHLSTEGVTEQKVARTPYRELVNMILKARLEIEAIKADDIREFVGEDGKSVVRLNRRHVMDTYSKGSGRVGDGPMALLTDRIEVVLRQNPELPNVKQIEIILCSEGDFLAWLDGARR